MSASILVVDDEPDVAELFRQRFRRETRQGTYVMHFAASGEEALAKLDDGIRPQLIVILSDINMPGMDGLELLARIRDLQPGTPTLLITGHGDHNIAIQALRGGAYDYIQKPIDPESFIRQMERFL